MKPSHYNLIKNLEDKDIRNLSKVIENSIVTQMKKGNFSLRNKHKSMNLTKDESAIQMENNRTKKGDDQYVSHIRYGITCIDTNLELKKFIVKQTEKK